MIRKNVVGLAHLAALVGVFVSIPRQSRGL